MESLQLVAVTLKDVGVTVIVGERIPVPVRETKLSPALLNIFMVSLKPPTDGGVKVTTSLRESLLFTVPEEGVKE